MTPQEPQASEQYGTLEKSSDITPEGYEAPFELIPPETHKMHQDDDCSLNLEASKVIFDRRPQETGETLHSLVLQELVSVDGALEIGALIVGFAKLGEHQYSLRTSDDKSYLLDFSKETSGFFQTIIVGTNENVLLTVVRPDDGEVHFHLSCIANI